MSGSKPPYTSGQPLAIIISAIKPEFFREAVASIAAQTDRRFQVYVFDDCGPEPIRNIVEEFAGRVPVRYHRFDTNLGGVSLVRQWERCIRLTSEPWVWIFADDDVMEPGCVADFYAELERTQAGHDLYRFDTVWIDGQGKQISESPRHPRLERGTDFLLARLSDRRNVTMQEVVFSRQAWERAGGLPDFPLGWHADEAFTASLGIQRPLCAIHGARIWWRYSSVNISSVSSYTITNQKIIASTQFFGWVAGFFEANATSELTTVTAISERWLINYMESCWEFIGWRACFAIDTLARQSWRRQAGWGICAGLRINILHLTRKVAGGIRRKIKSE